MGNCICKDGFEATESWEAWNKAPIGTGPYKVAEFRPGEYIKLEAFDGYWGQKAPAKTITFKIVPETAARVAGLLTGEFHIVTEIMPDQFKTIEKNPDTEIVGGPINNIRVIFYDKMADATLADARIRQALNYAIDRELLVETIYAGRTGVPRGLQMESFGDLYVDDFKSVTYDPEKAKQLLKEAGYKNQPISYRYLQDYYTGEVSTAQILVEMWRQVGLKVKLELKENWDQIESDGARKGRGIINWSNTAVYPDPLSQIHRNYGPAGFFQRHDMWKNEDFNKWGEALQQMDPQKRREAMENMLQIYEYDDPPGTYLYYLPMFYGKRKSVKWDAVGTMLMDMGAFNLSFE
jgi:peptide/nickel transport system substrate-binding protein